MFVCGVQLVANRVLVVVIAARFLVEGAEGEVRGKNCGSV